MGDQHRVSTVVDGPADRAVRAPGVIDLRSGTSSLDAAVSTYRTLHQLSGGPFPQRQGLLEDDVRVALRDDRTITGNLVDAAGQPVAVPVLTPVDIVNWYSEEFRRARFPEAIDARSPMWHLSTYPGLSDEAFEQLALPALRAAALDPGALLFTDHAERADDPSTHRLDAVLAEVGPDVHELALVLDGPAREHYFAGRSALVDPGRPLHDSEETHIHVGASHASFVDELWAIYEAPFLELAELTPLRTYFTHDEMAAALQQPGVTHVEQRVDGRLVSWMMLSSDIGSFPWMDPAAIRAAAPDLPEDRIYIFPGLVTDPGYQGNHYADRLIHELTYALVLRDPEHLIVFETLDRNAAFLPGLIAAACDASGYGSIDFTLIGTQLYRSWRLS